MDIIGAILAVMFLVLLFYAFFKSEEPDYYYPECTCGKYDKCVDAIKITSRGTLHQNPENMVRCGNWQEEINKLSNIKTTNRRGYDKLH